MTTNTIYYRHYAKRERLCDFYTSQLYYFWLVLVKQKRKMAIEFMEMMKLELTGYGNTHLNAGHIIRVNLPRAGDGKTDIKSTQYDKNLSGRWLITDVRHKFNFEETSHQSLYTCVKETYGRSQSEDTGPLNLTSDDEALPVNLYDDSAYI